MRVLSIQDLSCMGKCSLTVALPILSCMGLSASVLPTAVLSTHTGFAEPVCRSFTEEIGQIADHWQRIGAEFDAVSVGYLSDPRQAEAVEGVLERFPALTVIDPAMGDHGRLYSGMTPAHVQAMKKLCARGDYLLPNVTEAALLTDTPYRQTTDRAYLEALAGKLMDFGCRGAVITGVRWDDETTGFYGFCREQGAFSYKTERIPRQCHGTGDMFCAVTMGALALGSSFPAAAEKAAGFVERVLLATPQATPFGAAFERALPFLLC